MADIHRDRQRDAAGIGPYAQDAERLVRLSDLGKWDVAEGEPDIRGWEVRTIGGRDLGKVTELLVDPDAGEVVMIDVDLTPGHQHALVPLRIIEIDRGRRVVRMDSSDLTPAEQAAVEDAGSDATGSRAASTRDRNWADTGRVRYPGRADDEVVVERRPIVEEVVVRRRLVDEGESVDSVDARPRTTNDDEQADRAT